MKTNTHLGSKEIAVPLIELDLKGGIALGAGAIDRVYPAIRDIGEMAPSSGPGAFFGEDGGGAGKAANGGEAHGVEGVLDHAGMGGIEGVEIGVAEFGEGVDAQGIHGRVDAEDGQAGTSASLGAAQGAQQDIVTAAKAPKRRELAFIAALFLAFVGEVQKPGLGCLFGEALAWMERDDLEFAVGANQLVAGSERFGVKHFGIDKEHIEGQIVDFGEMAHGGAGSLHAA